MNELDKALHGYTVIKTIGLREGEIFIDQDPRRIVLGTRPPSEYEAIVMEGIAKAHPWFHDPLTAGKEAWEIIEKTAKEQGYEMRVKTRGAKP